MNKIFIIGNGFDLAHGLETKYSDFVFWYLKESIINARKNNNFYVDKLIRIDFPKFFDSEIFYIAEVSKSIENFKNELRKEDIKIHFHLAVFQELFENFYNGNWVNIEYFYYVKLVILFNSYNEKNKDNIIKFNESFGFLKLKLAEYISKLTISKNIYKESIQKIFQNEIPFYNIGLGEELKSEVLLLNFNYTSTVDLYSNELNKKHIRQINIHGRVNDESNPIIFGYGDEFDPTYRKIEQSNVNEFLKNIKSFYYFKTNNYQKVSLFLNSEPYDVIILGHSCGITDRILLSSIFENNYCRKIKIYYHGSEGNKNDYFEKTQEISRHFKPENKDAMRNKIVPFSESLPLS